MVSDKAIIEKDYLRIKRGRHGLMMYNFYDLLIGLSMDTYGEWAEPEMALLEQFITYGDTVIDVGANIGTHTLFFAQAVRASGRVYAFEPQRIAFQMLCGNVALNGLQHVYTHQMAVGSKKGMTNIPFIDPHTLFNYGAVSTSLVSEKGFEAIPQVTLDQFPLSRCDLIKIDVEGAESEVLQGAKKLIKKFKPVIYLENHFPEHSSAILKTLFSLGYRCWWHIYERYNPHNFFRRENYFDPPNQLEINLLCLHKDHPTEDYDLSQLEPLLNKDETSEKALLRHQKRSKLN